MAVENTEPIDVVEYASTTRRIAAQKLVEIFREARAEGDAERLIEVVRALGATGSAAAAEWLKETYDLADPTRERELRHEVVRALGEVARHAR